MNPLARWITTVLSPMQQQAISTSKLNHQVAPTDDVHIRKAIAYATDYNTIRAVSSAGRAFCRAFTTSFCGGIS